MFYRVYIPANVSGPFFSKLSPETLVQLMLIMEKLPFLPVGFHKYYGLYKFFEFIPELNLGNIQNYVKPVLFDISEKFIK